MNLQKRSWSLVSLKLNEHAAAAATLQVAFKAAAAAGRKVASTGAPAAVTAHVTRPYSPGPELLARALRNSSSSHSGGAPALASPRSLQLRAGATSVCSGPGIILEIADKAGGDLLEGAAVGTQRCVAAMKPCSAEELAQKIQPVEGSRVDVLGLKQVQAQHEIRSGTPRGQQLVGHLSAALNMGAAGGESSCSSGEEFDSDSECNSMVARMQQQHSANGYKNGIAACLN